LEVREYDYLFAVDRPMEVAPRADGTPGSFMDNLAPESLKVNTAALGEPCLAQAEPLDHYQFERSGYYTRDPDSGADGRPVFNKTVGLRDTWAKIVKQGGGKG
jgi:glutaminyl-tRNA synthetase